MVRATLFLFGVPILGIIIALLTGCGDTRVPTCNAPAVGATEAYIVSGEESVDRRSTVQVWSDSTGGYCSGTIIGPRTVLTSAHCEDLNDILVPNVDWFEVVGSETHEGYSFPHRDLQVVYTDVDLPPPYAVIPVEVPDCSSLLAQGFGVGSAGRLHERGVEDYGRAFGIIWTSEGICNGDSGGPLYTDSGLLVGVASFGLRESCDGPAGYVDLLVEGDWVRDRIR